MRNNYPIKLCIAVIWVQYCEYVRSDSPLQMINENAHAHSHSTAKQWQEEKKNIAQTFRRTEHRAPAIWCLLTLLLLQFSCRIAHPPWMCVFGFVGVCVRLKNDFFGISSTSRRCCEKLRKVISQHLHSVCLLIIRRMLFHLSWEHFEPSSSHAD